MQTYLLGILAVAFVLDVLRSKTERSKTQPVPQESPPKQEPDYFIPNTDTEFVTEEEPSSMKIKDEEGEDINVSFDNGSEKKKKKHKKNKRNKNIGEIIKLHVQLCMS